MEVFLGAGGADRETDMSTQIVLGGGNDLSGERSGMILGLAATAVSRHHLRN